MDQPELCFHRPRAIEGGKVFFTLAGLTAYWQLTAIKGLFMWYLAMTLRVRKYPSGPPLRRIGRLLASDFLWIMELTRYSQWLVGRVWWAMRVSNSRPKQCRS